VLTIDLTNRCNMMCDPCFADANQVGFVHELSWEDIKTMLDNAITIAAPPDVGAVLGGEPTLSHIQTQSATPARLIQLGAGGDQRNRTAKSLSLHNSREAGMRYAYLQFDGPATLPTRTASRQPV
jgi:uncharacterized radical SAM superfamily Fe-S cluster-containing enzyme